MQKTVFLVLSLFFALQSFAWAQGIGPLVQSKSAQPTVELHRQPRYFSVVDRLEDEAAASDPAGIHIYSEDLIELVVPERAGQAYRDKLTDRLARAEEAAQAGKQSLVPESDVVRAYNSLMKQLGAPASLYADDAEMRVFRAHHAEMHALSAVITADRNGKSCTPDEAVALLYLLLSDNGRIAPAGFGESTRTVVNRTSGKMVAGVRSAPMNQTSQGLIFLYSLEHRPHATAKLFNDVVPLLGF